MSRSLALALTLAAGTVMAGWTRPALAQSVENAQGMARHWTNVAGFINTCVERELLDRTHRKYVRFGSYMGGFLLGALFMDQSAVGERLGPYLEEGSLGRVHDFDEQGNYMAYTIEFTQDNCGTVSNSLSTSFERFSKMVLRDDGAQNDSR